MGRFVDLHAHLLPALDDGVTNLADAVTLGRQLVELGFAVLHATPHQKLGVFSPSAERIAHAHAAVVTAYAAAHVSVELRLGAENFWDEQFVTRARGGVQPHYTGDGAFLVEVDVRMPPPDLDAALFRLRVAGALPVLAHPERYLPLHTPWPDRIAAIGRGAALLVDLAAIDGAHGRAEGKAARRLVEEGLAHGAASDVHSPSDIRAVAAGMAWIKKRFGEKRLSLLLDENPRRILQGDLPD